MRQAELVSMLERTADAAFAVDQRGVIRSWNAAATCLFGYPASEIIGQPCASVFGGLDPAGMRTCSANCDVRACAFKGQLVSAFDLYVRIASGSRLWINISTIVAGDPASGDALMLHLARDVTARKDREALLLSMIAAARLPDGEAMPPADEE